MLEKAPIGDRKYWAWVGFLFLLIGAGGFFYLRQLDYGLGITGMSRNVSWALYIAQFTFLVGVAASSAPARRPSRSAWCSCDRARRRPRPIATC